MDSVYQEKQAPAKEQQRQQEQSKKKKAERAEKKNKLKEAAQAAQAMIQATAGADLAVPGESLRVLAECVGNQNMVRALAKILGGGDGNLKLSTQGFLLGFEDLDGILPENQITVSWPALRPVVRLDRMGSLPKEFFPVSALREEILQKS